MFPTQSSAETLTFHCLTDVMVHIASEVGCDISARYDSEVPEKLITFNIDDSINIDMKKKPVWRLNPAS